MEKPSKKPKNLLNEIVEGNSDLKVWSDGEIWKGGRKVGKLYSDGEVYAEGQGKIGKIYSDGEVYAEGQGKIGKIYNDGGIYAEGKGCTQRFSTIGRAIIKKRIIDTDPIEGFLEYGECFVATAVYGNRNTPEVQTLRDFRDNVLMRSSIGRLFVDFYYSGAGKRTANFIRECLPSTIPIIRKGLDVLVERYSTQRKKSKGKFYK